MKIFCHIPRENWIVDRIGKDFRGHSQHTASFNDLNCDLVWILAPWCWKQIPHQVLKHKKVVCTIHHEVPEKFDEKRKTNSNSKNANTTAPKTKSYRRGPLIVK